MSAAKPQSIVHHFVWAASVITKPVRKHGKFIRRSIRCKKSITSEPPTIAASNKNTDNETTSSNCSSVRHHHDDTCSSAFWSEDEEEHNTSSASRAVSHRPASCSPTIPEDQSLLSPLALIEKRMAALGCVLETSAGIPEPSLIIESGQLSTGSLRTINQNEFLMECLVQGQGSSVIHFFDNSSQHSQVLDTHLQALALRLPTCKFLRIDSNWTHFVASKLQITKFPTLLALQDKIVLDRLTDFGSSRTPMSRLELERWLTRTIPLIQEYLEFGAQG